MRMVAEGKCSGQDFSYSQRDSQHKINPYRRRARQAEVMRLDCNAAQWSSSLRLIVQSNTVFIVSFSEHRPWNLLEGHRRTMTKGNMVSKECYHGRKAFGVKGNNQE